MYREPPRITVCDLMLEGAANLYEIFGGEETIKHCEPAYRFEKTKKFLKDFCIG